MSTRVNPSCRRVRPNRWLYKNLKHFYSAAAAPLAALVLHLWSVVTIARSPSSRLPPLKLQIAHFDRPMHHPRPIFGVNFLLHSVNHILIILLPTLLIPHTKYHLFRHHHSHHPSLTLSDSLSLTVSSKGFVNGYSRWLCVIKKVFCNCRKPFTEITFM